MYAQERTGYIVSMTIGILVIVTVAGHATAQSSSSLLKSIRVERILERKPTDAMIAELGLTAEQIQQLEVLRKERLDLYESISESQGLPEEQRRMRAESFRKAMAAMNDRVEEILLPHQSLRLRQVLLQARGQSMASGFALLEPRVQAELSITESQSKELAKKVKEVEAELRREMLSLQEKARKKVLESLTPAQQAKYRELFGDVVEQGAIP